MDRLLYMSLYVVCNIYFMESIAGGYQCIYDAYLAITNLFLWVAKIYSEDFISCFYYFRYNLQCKIWTLNQKIEDRRLSSFIDIPPLLAGSRCRYEHWGAIIYLQGDDIKCSIKRLYFCSNIRRKDSKGK